MIVKEKFFDIISRTADDVNNSELTMDEILHNFVKREEKYKIELEKKPAEIITTDSNDDLYNNNNNDYNDNIE